MRFLVRQNCTYEKIFHDREEQYAAIVKAELRKILPGFAVVDFSPFILGDEGFRRKPDLALVDRTYSKWAVVEVELERHPLEEHVLPQVHTFVTGRYERSHASLLHRKEPTLDLDRLYNLVEYAQPEVLVVVNSRTVLNDGWEVLETEHSAHLTFLETFRSINDDVIFEISGYLPARKHREVIQLRKHKMMNALVCMRPGDIPASVTDEIRMYCEERLYYWRTLRTMDTVLFLTPPGFKIRGDRNYELVQIDEQTYRLRVL